MHLNWRKNPLQATPQGRGSRRLGSLPPLLRASLQNPSLQNPHLPGSLLVRLLLLVRPLRLLRRPLVGPLLLVALLLGGPMLLSAPAHADGGPSLDVPVSTVRNTRGVVFVALYDQPNWLKPGRFITARKVAAQKGTVVARFHGLRPGRYSVAVFHDENGNGRVDRNFVGLPAEGFGFSRTTPRRVPHFSETSFSLRQPATQPVHLRY